MRWPESIGTGVFAALLGVMLVPQTSVRAPVVKELPDWSHPLVNRDLTQIKKDTLRILVLADPLTWEKRPGAQVGLEWELISRFAKRLKVPFKAVPVTDQQEMLMMLQKGAGDLIAAQITAEGWAAPYVACTQPYRRIASVKATAAIRSGKHGKGSNDTAPDSVMVSRWSPFLDSLGQQIYGDTSWVLHVADDTPDGLMTKLALGDLPALLTSDATAAMEAKRLPLVKFQARIGRSVPLVFGVRANATHLLHALDTWMAQATERDARNAMIAAYNNGLETRGPVRSFHAMALGADSISPYDSLFQLHAESNSWNWKLLAAVAYKESRFDTAAVSYMGAGGLMQMMPATAAMMGVTKGSGLDGHIKGASDYLGKLDAIWRKSVSSGDQRLKFVLASYNAGPGHVRDAQRLAEDLGLDPHRWDGNVERAIVLLNRPRYFTAPGIKTGYCRGQDTYWYVRDVVTLFAWLGGKDER